MPTSRTWLTRANGLSFVRLACVPAVVLAICADAAVAAVAIFLLAVATDFGDGLLARRYREASPLGRLIDHSADALFVTAATAALAFTGVLPYLLPALIAASFFQYALDSSLAGSIGSISLRPSSLGRWNGIAYYAIVALPIVRDALGLAWPGASLVTALGWLLVATTLVSIADRLRFSVRG